MRQSHPTTERIPSHRAPRVWPALSVEPIVIPLVKPESSPQLTSLFVTAASVLGIGLAAVFMNQSKSAGGGLGLGLLLVSGATAVVSSAVAVGQFVATRRRNARLLQLYRRELDRLIGGSDGKEGGAQMALRMEAEWRRANDLPISASDATSAPGATLPPNTAASLAERITAHPETLWQRTPSDPDFLTIRIGTGRARARTRVELSEKTPAVRLPERDAGFARQQRRATDFVDGAGELEGVPIVVPLRAYGSVAVVASQAYRDMANDVVRAMLGQFALLHSPYDAQIVVIAPEGRATDWLWVNALSAGIEREVPAVIGYSAPATDARIEQVHPSAAQIEQLHAMLTQREQRLIERSSHQANAGPLGPHLVIVLDTLLPQNGQHADHLLTLAPVALALRRGVDIGVTVISTHPSLELAPAQCGLVIDPQAREARVLGPQEPAILPCAAIDRLTPHESQFVARPLSRYQPQRDGERELPSSVDLLTLFGPAPVNPRTYDIDALWARGRAKLDAGETAAFTIPIGRTTAPEPLTIDFLSDGPHGLLIGKTGSGKSVLLQSLITALAVTYPPDKLNFVLVDYKGGLGLDAYAELPHTLAFLTNLQAPGQTERFLIMLESEIRSRQELRKAKQPMPRLFVIIDEFAEMVARGGATGANSDAIMDQMLRILRLGRQLDVHLLFASQRPESAFSKLQGYVQYRISMRTNSADDSREIIGRPDAASLPARIPGRGYLLRGDYQLQLFQAARVEQPLASGRAGESPGLDEPATNGELIARRMRDHIPPTAGRWPATLPTPSSETPSPLVLYLHGRPRRGVKRAWATSGALPQRPSDMVVPIGWLDRPDERKQDWYPVDLLGHQSALRGGPLLVAGDPNAGKSTTLQTLTLFFATTYTPDELRIFAIDPTSAFSEFAALRHTRDLADSARSNVIDGGDEAAFGEWRQRLKTAMEDTNRRARLLVVIDDIDDVSQRLSSTARANLASLTQEVIRGRPRGAYLAISAAKQPSDILPSHVLSAMSTKIVLHMASSTAMSALVTGRIPTSLEPIPGRGFAQTRYARDTIQVAAPVYGSSEVERMEGIRAILAESRWRVE